MGGGGARANFDYFFRPQRQPSGASDQRIVTFLAGQSQVKVCLITVADDDNEGDETVTLAILESPTSSYAIGTPNRGTVTILDGD